MKALYLFATTVLVIWSCAGNGRRDITDYYFPAMALRDGLVYEYDVTTSNSDTAIQHKEYWYYRGFLRDSGLFLSSTCYDNQYQITQIVREKFTETGSIIREVFLYEPDTASGKLQQIPAHLDGRDAFPFRVTDSLGVYLYSLDYRLPNDPSGKIYVIRNRRYLGDGKDWAADGQQLPTVRIGVKEAVGNEKEGSTEIAVKGEEWYAKGIGLVYLTKYIGTGAQIKREMKLAKRYPMTQLEQNAAKQFGIDSIPPSE